MGALESAQAEVALKYDPQQAHLQRQLDALKAQTAANEAGINEYGVQGRAGIGTAYDTLNSLLTGNRATSAGEQAITGQQIGSIYDTGATNTQNLANASRQRLAALAAHTGAGPGGELQVLQPFETEQARVQGALAMAKANALENQKGWASRWDQILGQGINIGEQTRAQEASRFETELLNRLGENKVTGLEGENEMYGRLGDILGMRQNDLIASFERLQQQEWENAFAQAQLDQEASIANAELAMQKYGIDAQNARAAAELAAENELTFEEMLAFAQEQQKIDDERAYKQGQTAQGQEGLSLQRRDIANAERSTQMEADRLKYQTGNETVSKYISDFFTTGDKKFDEKEAQQARALARSIYSGMPNQYYSPRSSYNVPFGRDISTGQGINTIPFPETSGPGAGGGVQIPSWMKVSGVDLAKRGWNNLPSKLKWPFG